MQELGIKKGNGHGSLLQETTFSQDTQVCGRGGEAGGRQEAFSLAVVSTVP